MFSKLGVPVVAYPGEVEAGVEQALALAEAGHASLVGISQFVSSSA